VYFDSRRMVDGGVRDWRVTTSAASTQAFQTLSRALKADLRKRR